MARGAAAEEQVVEIGRLGQLADFDFEGVQEAIDKMVPASNQREIAVAAPMLTERNMDVSGSRRHLIGAVKKFSRLENSASVGFR